MKIVNRVKKSSEFQTIIQQGATFKNKSFVGHFLVTTNNRVRVGISVSKRRGNAVRRNKIKRQIRSICMENINLTESYDLIIVAREQYDVEKFDQMREDLLEIVRLFERKTNV